MDFIGSIPTHMDFDGQAKAERWSRIIITLFGAVGFIWGCIIQQFSQTVYILGAGFVLAALFVRTNTQRSLAICNLYRLLTIPPWPIYRKKPLKWQTVKDSEISQPRKSKKKN